VPTTSTRAISTRNWVKVYKHRRADTLPQQTSDDYSKRTGRSAVVAWRRSLDNESTRAKDERIHTRERSQQHSFVQQIPSFGQPVVDLERAEPSRESKEWGSSLETTCGYERRGPDTVGCNEDMTTRHPLRTCTRQYETDVIRAENVRFSDKPEEKECIERLDQNKYCYDMCPKDYCLKAYYKPIEIAKYGAINQDEMTVAIFFSSEPDLITTNRVYR
jgi:hypothetical protein